MSHRCGDQWWHWWPSTWPLHMCLSSLIHFLVTLPPDNPTNHLLLEVVLDMTFSSNKRELNVYGPPLINLDKYSVLDSSKTSMACARHQYLPSMLSATVPNTGSHAIKANNLSHHCVSLCPPMSANVVLTVSDSELTISFILSCFPWFLLLTLTTCVHRMTTCHHFHFTCPDKPARVLSSWSENKRLLYSCMRLSVGIQADKIM